MIECLDIQIEYQEITSFLLKISRIYSEFLSKSSEALTYVQKRQWDQYTMIDRHIGYAPDTSLLLQRVRKENLSEELLIKSGLFLEYPDYTVDLFENRLIFPIKDILGNIISFSGRILDDTQSTSKYVNSLSTSWFSKSLSLYNIDLASKSSEDFIILVEGIPDAVSFIQSSVENVVAPCGTAVTEEQILILKYLSKKIIILMDGDSAGKKSTMRVESMLRSSNVPFLSLTLVNPEDRDKKIDPDEYIHKYGIESILEAIKD